MYLILEKNPGYSDMHWTEDAKKLISVVEELKQRKQRAAEPEPQFKIYDLSGLPIVSNIDVKITVTAIEEDDDNDE